MCLFLKLIGIPHHLQSPNSLVWHGLLHTHASSSYFMLNPCKLLVLFHILYSSLCLYVIPYVAASTWNVLQPLLCLAVVFLNKSLSCSPSGRLPRLTNIFSSFFPYHLHTSVITLAFVLKLSLDSLLPLDFKIQKLQLIQFCTFFYRTMPSMY